MSTTVTYKGEDLVTVNNDTVTLETEGKYLEADIILEDVSGGGSPTLETVTKTYTPTETQQTEQITPSPGYDGMEEVDVTVNAISPNYVGSGITRRDSTDMSASGGVVTAPAGYYANNGAFTMEQALGHFTESIDANGLITMGYEFLRAGYQALGSTSTTRQLDTQAGGTITPSNAQQTAILAGKFATGDIKVDPIPSQYIVPSGSETKNANGTYDVTSLAEMIVAVPTDLVKYGLRPDATLVQAFTYDKLMHADEQITLPGYSTSAQTIKASAALGTITLDRDNYQYYVVERFLTIPSYSVTSHNKGRCEYHIGAHAYEIIDIPGSSMHSLIEPTRFYTSRLNTITTTMASYREIYYSGSSTLTTYSTQAYGVCQAAVAPSMSSGVLTINSPTVTCRGSTTYFTSTYANALTDVRAQYVIEVYKVPKNHLNLDGWSNDQLMKQIIACVNSATQKLS